MKSLLTRPYVCEAARARRLKARWYAALAVVFATTAVADMSSNVALNLDQLIAAAERDNKDLRAARFAIDAARARLVQAGALPNPRINLGAGSDFAFRNEGAYSASVGVSQDFPIAGRLARQKDVARVDVDLAQAEILDAQRKLAGEIAANVYRILIVDRQMQARDSLSAVDERLEKVTRSRFKAAEVSELDVNTIALDLQRLAQERLLFQTQRRTLLQSLNQKIGRPVNAPLDVVERLPAIDTLPPLDVELSAALAQRPDQRQASLQIDRAQAELGLANAKRWEDWSVGLGVQQDRQSIIGAPGQPADRALALNVTIPLSLKSRTQGLISEAAVGVRKSRAQSDALTQQIGSEVGAAHAEATSLQILYKNYESTLLPVTARNVELAQKGYERGLVPLLEVIQARRQEADLRTNALNTLDLYLQAYARLRTAVGDFPHPIDESP